MECGTISCEDFAINHRKESGPGKGDKNRS